MSKPYFQVSDIVHAEIGGQVREQFCRTCGFIHPEDDCPRWPADQEPCPMFDAMTREQLHDHQATLYTQHQAVFERIMTMAPYGSDYQILKAHGTDLGEQLGAIYAELRRRDAEETADV